MRSKNPAPISALLDNGIFCHSEFAEPAISQKSIRWGGRKQIATIHGMKRKPAHKNPDFQQEINALPTVGRLIRENAIEAYTSNEIWCEAMRFRPLLPFGNALRNCPIGRCPPAIDRSKFMQTTNVTEYFAKGGKKDRKLGIAIGPISQIAFLESLCALTPESVVALTSHSEMLRLTKFEIESLQDIGWFQFLCKRCGSPENYPDVFHLWTAERNHLDVLLTLDDDLPKLVYRVSTEKKKTVEIKTQVLWPPGLLDRIGIKDRDPVELEDGRLY
jgi:hypothetical protein